MCSDDGAGRVVKLQAALDVRCRGRAVARTKRKAAPADA
jgi:hypothetical protein